MTNIGPGKSAVIEPVTFPVLYILIRNDLESMNPGKAMAQASHASNAFARHMNRKLTDDDDKKLYVKWENETEQGFGTVFVLAVNESQMRTAAEIADTLGYISGVVHDPTYPLRDGDFCHSIPLDTCAYVFGDKNDTTLAAIIGNFPLHP